MTISLTQFRIFAMIQRRIIFKNVADLSSIEMRRRIKYDRMNENFSPREERVFLPELDFNHSNRLTISKAYVCRSYNFQSFTYIHSFIYLSISRTTIQKKIIRKKYFKTLNLAIIVEISICDSFEHLSVD